MTILKWNLLIKSYGEVKLKKNEPFKRAIPFRLGGDNPLKVFEASSCANCHYEGGPRNILTSENSETIKHLVVTKSMPPWPYTISPQDKKYIKEFIYGF